MDDTESKEEQIVITTLSTDELTDYICRQLNHFYPDKQVVKCAQLKPFVSSSLERMEYCISHFKRTYFNKNGNPYFDHLHSDQYAMFLYFLSNTIFKEENHLNISAKIYYLNKSLHAIDAFYAIELPDIFYFNHCVGTVLGRAKYANFFAVAPNCIIGGNHGHWPVFGEYVGLYKNATVVGNVKTGSNVHITPHTVVRDQDIPKDTIVFGSSPNLVFKKPSCTVKEFWFDGKS